jgi:hypothetical protein
MREPDKRHAGPGTGATISAPAGLPCPAAPTSPDENFVGGRREVRAFQGTGFPFRVGLPSADRIARAVRGAVSELIALALAVPSQPCR